MMEEKFTYRLVDEDTWQRCLILAEDPANKYEETNEIVKRLKEARRTPADTDSREWIEFRDELSELIDGLQNDEKWCNPQIMADCIMTKYPAILGALPAPQSPVVPDCWELLAKVHTIAVMNDGALPGATMREMKEALEAYPEYRSPVVPGVDLSNIQRWEEYDFGITRHSWGPWVKYEDVRRLLANARESREGVLREVVKRQLTWMETYGGDSPGAKLQVSWLKRALATVGKEV